MSALASAMRMQPQPSNDADEVVALSLDRARHGPQHPAAELNDRCPKVAAIAEVSSPDDFTFFLEHFTDTDCTFLEHFKDTDSYSNIIETMSDVLEQRLTDDGATLGMVHEHLELIYTPKPGHVELEQLKMPSLRRLMRGLLPEGDDKAARDLRRAGNEPEELAWYTIINGPNEGVYSCRIAPQARSPGDGHTVCDALYDLHIKPLVDGYSQARCYGYDAGIHTELAARRLLTLHERQRASFLERAMLDAASDRMKSDAAAASEAVTTAKEAQVKTKRAFDASRTKLNRLEQETQQADTTARQLKKKRKQELKEESEAAAAEVAAAQAKAREKAAELEAMSDSEEDEVPSDED